MGLMTRSTPYPSNGSGRRGETDNAYNLHWSIATAALRRPGTVENCIRIRTARLSGPVQARRLYVSGTVWPRLQRTL